MTSTMVAMKRFMASPSLFEFLIVVKLERGPACGEEGCAEYCDEDEELYDHCLASFLLALGQEPHRERHDDEEACDDAKPEASRHVIHCAFSGASSWRRTR